MAIEAVARYAYRALVAMGGVSLIATLVLAFTLPHLYGSILAQAWAWGAVAPLYVVGLFAVVTRPDHLSARWLGAAGSLLAVETVVRRVMQLGEVNVPWSVAGTVTVQVAALSTAAAIASVLVVFPDDHYRYRYQRQLLWTIWIAPPLIPVLLLVSQPSLYFAPTWTGVDDTNPAFVPDLSPLGSLAEAAFRWQYAALWSVGVGAMVVRYHRASHDARRQFRWPLAAAAALVALDAASRSLNQFDPSPVILGVPLQFFGLIPGLVMLSVSILVALVRHRLIGIDLWLRRTVLFGGTSAVIALAYLGVAGSAGWAAGQKISVGVGVTVTPFPKVFSKAIKYGERLTDGVDLSAVRHDLDGLRLTPDGDRWTLEVQLKKRDPESEWRDWQKDGATIVRAWAPAYRFDLPEEKARYYQHAFEVLDRFTHAKTFPGGHTRSTARKLRATKIPVFDPAADLTPLVELSEERAAVQQRIARTDALIDCIVYRLYGLTDEEIAVVEGVRAT